MAKDPESFHHNLYQIQRGKLGSIRMDRHGLDDIDIKYLAKALGADESLKFLGLSDNEFGDDGLIALISALADNNTLIELDAHDNDFSATSIAEVEKSFAAGQHKNMLSFDGVSDAVDKACQNNRDTAHKLIEKLWDFEQATPDDWCEMLERKQTIRYLNSSIGMSLRLLDDFVDTLPAVDLTQAVTFELLTTKPEGSDYTPLDNPKTWQQFEGVVAAMNQSGHYLNGNALLENGELSELGQRIVTRGKSHAIFTEENWREASSEEFRAVANAFPPESRPTATMHRLMASVGRNRSSEQQAGIS